MVRIARLRCTRSRAARAAESEDRRWSRLMVRGDGVPTGYWVLSWRGAVVDVSAHERRRRVAPAHFGWSRAEVPSDVSEPVGADVVGARRAVMICEYGPEMPRMIADAASQGSRTNHTCHTAPTLLAGTLNRMILGERRIWHKSIGSQQEVGIQVWITQGVGRWWCSFRRLRAIPIAGRRQVAALMRHSRIMCSRCDIAQSRCRRITGPQEVVIHGGHSRLTMLGGRPSARGIQRPATLRL
jgi:hypothetical protein